MANAEVNLSNKLADRILQDARSDAEKTMLSAEEEIRKIKEDCDKKAAAFLEEAGNTRNAAVKSVIDGCLTRASLDGRKNLLSQKRAVIDQVFDRTYQKLLDLSDPAKSSIYELVIKREAVKGDTIVPAGKDRSILENVIKGLPELNLKFSENSSSIEGGFLIIGSGYEKDCSLRSILSDLRDSEETNVAKLLFD